MTIARHLARSAAALGLATLLVAPQRAAAQITYQGYPAPGGTSFSGGGSAGSASGFDGRYSGFDDTQWGDLYWTYTDIANPWVSGQGGNATGNMAFSGYDAGTGLATWHSTANMEFTDAFGFHHSVPTIFTLQFKPYGSSTGQISGSLALAPTTAGAAGIATLPSNYPVLDVGSISGGHEFGVWARYSAITETGQEQPLLDWYNGIHTGNTSVQTSRAGTFFATDPVTASPEPTSVVLLGTGLLGVFGAVRQRRKPV